MSRRLRGQSVLTVFFTVNMVGLLLCGIWFYISEIGRVSAASRVTELDRQGVINEQKLREYKPELAENMRGKLGAWIAAPDHSSAVSACVVGVALCLANLCAVAYFVTRAAPDHDATDAERINGESNR